VMQGCVSGVWQGGDELRARRGDVPLNGRALSLVGLGDLPLMRPGNNLADLVDAALATERIPLMDGDILVVPQKIVSKSQGRYVGQSRRRRDAMLGSFGGDHSQLAANLCASSARLRRRSSWANPTSAYPSCRSAGTSGPQRHLPRLHFRGPPVEDLFR
jgi:hypothetical protein